MVDGVDADIVDVSAAGLDELFGVAAAGTQRAFAQHIQQFNPAVEPVARNRRAGHIGKNTRQILVG